MAGRFKSNCWKVAAFLVVLFAVLIFTNFRLVIAMEASEQDFIESTALALALGMGIGQINLISIWSALAPGQIVARIPWVVLLTVCFWASICVGMDEGYSAASRYELAIVLLATQLIAQLPLWLGSRVWAWRLVTRRQIQEGLHQTDNRFGLKGLMLGTCFLAITLAIVRGVMSEFDGGWSDVSFDPQILFLLTVAVCTNLSVVVPCIWLAFRPRRELPRVLARWCGLVVLVSVIEIAVLSASLGGPPNLVMTTYVCVLLNLTQCATVVVVLLALRRVGWRLVRMKKTDTSDNALPVPGSRRSVLTET